MRDLNEMQKGLAKVRQGEKRLKSKDPIKGKRQVQINRTTWVYTSKDLSDQEIIEQFNKKYGL